jgi:hypothetical protein
MLLLLAGVGLAIGGGVVGIVSADDAGGCTLDAGYDNCAVVQAQGSSAIAIAVAGVAMAVGSVAVGGLTRRSGQPQAGAQRFAATGPYPPQAGPMPPQYGPR